MTLQIILLVQRLFTVPEHYYFNGPKTLPLSQLTKFPINYEVFYLYFYFIIKYGKYVPLCK